MTPGIYILKTYYERLSSGKGYANHKMYKQSEKKTVVKLQNKRIGSDPVCFDMPVDLQANCG